MEIDIFVYQNHQNEFEIRYWPSTNDRAKGNRMPQRLTRPFKRADQAFRALAFLMYQPLIVR